MDQATTIRKLRRQLLVERICIAAAATVLLAFWIAGQLAGSKSFILVDGKPVVCVPSERDAKELLDEIKTDTGLDPTEIQFRQSVTVARAPRDAQPVSRHKALGVVRRVVSPVAPRWAILVNGKAVVAVPDRDTAGETLDLAKLRFGKLAPNLAEEPQFKEEVRVEVASVDTSIFRKTADEAVELLFDSSGSSAADEFYTVGRGDIAGSIAARQGVKLEDLWALNPGTNLNRLQIGDRLRIRHKGSGSGPALTVVVRDRTERIERIAPPVQRVSSAQMFSGKTAEISPGRSGERRVVAVTIYENGRKVGSDVLEEEILREPQPRRIAVGIRPRR